MEQDVAIRLERLAEELSRLTDGIERSLKERDDNILVSCTEAARLLGKTTTTISTMIREKRLTKVTIGESTGIRLSEIQEYKNRREAREP